MVAASAPRGRSGMSIGQVLQELKGEFPDVSISKLRFLEAEGLIQPQRSASGYRRFSAEDVERLRYVLTAQRDHYYPLRVIKQHLDALSRGLEPPMVAGQLPRVPSAGGTAEKGAPPDSDGSGSEEPQRRRPILRLSADELRENAGLSEQQLEQLIDFGLVAPFPGADFYGEEALAIAAAVARLAKYGLEPRHLRTVKTAADREVGLIEHVIRPMRRIRGDNGQSSQEAAVAELTDLCLALHSSLMRAALAGGSAPA
jgi:DNA-binding transcriptional MerR regulator